MYVKQIFVVLVLEKKRLIKHGVFGLHRYAVTSAHDFGMCFTNFRNKYNDLV